MPDRRQNDRRESSGLQSKKFVISLTTFIWTVATVAIILIAIVVCFIVSRISYNKGYDEGWIDSASEIYEEDEVPVIELDENEDE